MALCYPNGRKKSDTKKLNSTTKCNHVLVWNQAEQKAENHLDEEVASPAGENYKLKITRKWWCLSNESPNSLMYIAVVMCVASLDIFVEKRCSNI